MLVFNFYTLYSQTIGHKKLILICTLQNESWDRKCDLDLQGKGHSAISETVVCRQMILICTHSK